MGKIEIKRVCVVCHCPQFHCESGWVCRNGHGGADWYPGEVEDYRGQRREWFSKALKEVVNDRYAP